MDREQAMLARLARPAGTKLVLLVLDGVGDVRTAEQPLTALDAATLPNLDALATRSALGRLVPVMHGVTPGSGPGHLGLFGYDPMTPEADFGRGVLEALGLGLEIGPGDVAVRGNFATADADGNLSDRRAGRIPTEEGRRVCAKMRPVLAEFERPSFELHAGEGYRFVLVLRGDELSAAVADTDPQRTGVPPLPLRALEPAGERTIELLEPALERMEAAIADEPAANRLLLRGFSKLPGLAKMSDLYHLRLGAFAGYPLYRGVAAACGMEVVPCAKRFHEIVPTVAARWQDFDYFFIHVKQTDQAGEDGDLAAKVTVLEEVDRALPELLALGPDVVAVTGDHSTPAPMKAHSWHPIPLLLWSDRCFADGSREFTEAAATAGHLGTIPSRALIGLMLANGRRLAKYGA